MSTDSTHHLPYGEVLIVDDNTANLRFLKDILTRAGYRVRPANDGKLALSSVQERLPELILMDYKMPGMNGIEVCRRLKADPETKDIPVIFLSALGESDLKVEALEAGGIDYVTKPIEPSELLVRIDNHLQMYRLQQRLADQSVELLKEIEERKRAEELGREREATFRSIFNTSIEGIFVFTLDNVIAVANPAASEMYGYTNNEMIGLSGADIVHQDYYHLFEDFKKQVQKTDKFHAESVDVRKDGTTFNVKVSGSSFLYKNEPHLLAMVSDITEQKRLKEELLQAHKMEAIGTLAGGIAHDFNNILSGIIGFSEHAKDHIQSDNPARKDIDIVIDSSRRAAELVQQILTFSRKSEQHLQALNPCLIVKKTLKMLASSLPSTVIIDEDIDGECGKIRADPTNIHQIMMNLCTNALHAMEEEKGTLTVKLYRREIAAEEVGSEPGVSAGPFVVLSVSDTGHGMDERTRERIFEPYFTTKETGKGTGIGLAVIHGIIQDYNGFIRVNSTPGEGSAFFVYIPALSGEAATIEDSAFQEPERKSPLPTAKVRILVVDDEPLLVKTHKRQLEYSGFTVTATADSRDALEKFRAQADQFDLLITDQTMPKLSGVELAKEVQKIRPDLPIILCTGHSDVVSKKDALAMGIKKYVSKPIYRDELFQAISDVLDKK